ncbi:hypothetical protein ACJVC5_18070 [Peredibacter sp. HCB2-198]|uniref:hypothetical protein n=1 Tax=Peredibacter sp. HCB2-198 TaxID=3383025 RepID=UPI0038B4BD1C
MLKLVFYTKDHRFKVRLALPEDDFSSSKIWQNKLEFIVSDSGQFTMVWTSLLPDLDPEYAESLVELVGARYPISPDYQTLQDLHPELPFKNELGEWVFFGGSFNPWHEGHQACLTLMPEDKMCFILPDRNPHKELRELSPVATILEISAHAKLKNLQFIVPTFLLEQKQNPTVNWVEKFKNDYPTHKVSLLMGFDSFSNLRNWTRSEALLPLLNTVYVVSRLEDDQDRREALDHARARGPHLNIVFLGKHEFEDVSSTEIRLRQK